MGAAMQTAGCGIGQRATRMLHPRVRGRTALGLQHRWWGVLSVSLQRAVARAITRDFGQDLLESLLEPVPGLADLALVA